MFFFGNYLVEQQVITEDQLNKALEWQKDNSDKLIGEILVVLGFIDRERMQDHLEDHLLKCAEIISTDPMFK